jgi:hypothetical protein
LQRTVLHMRSRLAHLLPAMGSQVALGICARTGFGFTVTQQPQLHSCALTT